MTNTDADTEDTGEDERAGDLGEELSNFLGPLTPSERINALYSARVIDANGVLQPDYQQALKNEIGRPGIVYMILGFGYVEEAIVGHHVYQIRLWEGEDLKEPPKTAPEAVKLLAKDFLELYRNELPPEGDKGQYYRNKCCNTYLSSLDKIETASGQRPEQDPLCPSCERELTQKDINIEHFQQWIYSLGKAHNDSFPCHDGTGGFGHWWPFASWAEILAAPKGTFLEIYESTEVLMCAALNPLDFEEGPNRTAVVEWQREYLELENRFGTDHDIDALIEKKTKRPGYGEAVH